jgi:hypothetical protein
VKNNFLKNKKMNREIKFRIYYELNNEILYHNIQMKLEKQRVHIPIVSTKGKILEVVQYTGLKDKNGKEIYDGDILDCEDRICKVVWHNQAGQWDSDFIKYKGVLKSNGIDNVSFKYRAVVIGNIYENPELLQTTS